MAADAGIIPMVLGGESQTLDFGRTRRLFTTAQRLALAERDGGCAWPGCPHPPSYTEAHHLRWWTAHDGDDGPGQRDPALLHPPPPHPRRRLAHPGTPPGALLHPTQPHRPPPHTPPRRPHPPARHRPHRMNGRGFDPPARQPAADGGRSYAGAMSSWHRELGVFDLETTGVDVDGRIVTAHVGLLDEDGEAKHGTGWSTRASPSPRAPPPCTASRTARGATGAPGEVVAEILAAIRSVFMRGFPLVVYNAPYDLTLLAAEADRHRLSPLEPPGPVVDPFVLDRAVDRFRRGKRTLRPRRRTTGSTHGGARCRGRRDRRRPAGPGPRPPARRGRSRWAHELHRKQVDWCGDQAERLPGLHARGSATRRSRRRARGRCAEHSSPHRPPAGGFPRMP